MNVCFNGTKMPSQSTENLSHSVVIKIVSFSDDAISYQHAAKILGKPIKRSLGIQPRYDAKHNPAYPVEHQADFCAAARVLVCADPDLAGRIYRPCINR
jgi:hypothetical protein